MGKTYFTSDMHYGDTDYSFICKASDINFDSVTKRRSFNIKPENSIYCYQLKTVYRRVLISESGEVGFKYLPSIKSCKECIYRLKCLRS